jgi:hypothetical protein
VVEAVNTKVRHLSIMDEKVTLVIGLTLLIVIGANVLLYFSFRDRSLPHQIELFRRAAQRARNPWQDEDDDLGELSNLVAKLKNKDQLKDEAKPNLIENEDE